MRSFRADEDSTEREVLFSADGVDYFLTRITLRKARDLFGFIGVIFEEIDMEELAGLEEDERSAKLMASQDAWVELVCKITENAEGRKPSADDVLDNVTLGEAQSIFNKALES